MIQFQNRQIQLPDGSPVIVSRIVGSIDGSTVKQFEDKLLGFLDKGVQHLIIVFSQVSYINSTGMGVLVKIADRFQEVGGDISLIDVPDKLIALFNMLGLLSLIKLSKSEEEALQTFQLSRSQAHAAAAGNPIPPAGSSQKPKEADKSAKKPAPEPRPGAARPQRANSGGAKKAVVIRCKKCNTKISLGSKPRAGTYKCPRCMAVFKLFQNGKLQFS